MHSHLLVATDFSIPSKAMVRRLHDFRGYGAEKITLIYVRRTNFPVEDSKSHQKYYQTLLEDSAGELRERGWKVDVRNEVGRPGSRIPEVADEVGAGLIVLANRGKSAVEDILLGSVATDVLERSTTPVFLFCADVVDDADDEDHRGLGIERIIHPTDFSEAAGNAMDWVEELAVAGMVPALVVHALDDRYESRAASREQRRALDELRQRLEDAGVTDVDSDLVSGKPRNVLDEIADHYPGALIVMGTHGRSWFGDLMLGGVARSMARRARHHTLFVPSDADRET